MFCKKCGTMLRPENKNGKKTFVCGSCRWSSETIQKPSFTEKHETKKIEVMEDIEIHPLVNIKCEKCGHNKAYHWTLQTRASDEPETKFFKCEKCKHVWRDYK